MTDRIMLVPKGGDLGILLTSITYSGVHEVTFPSLLKNSQANQKLFSIATENDVASLVAHKMSDAFGWEHIPDYWDTVHKKTFDRISSYLDELDLIASKLHEFGIQLVALKNSGIARGIYPCPGCCPMGDIDVLVEKRHFRMAHRVLLENGYQFEFRSPLEEVDLTAAEENGGAEYWKILPNGEKLWLELQWRPVAGRWIRPDQEPSSEELIARSNPIPGTAVRLLSPEDNLLQVALHTAKHSYVRAPGFRLHTDVDRIVRGQTINWSLFVKQVHQLQVNTAVYFSLAIPRLLFETPIPDEVLKSLRPAPWKERIIFWWIQRAGLLNPHERKFSRVGYILFTSLLYDDISGLWRGMFPDRKWMQERYGFQSRWLLPYYHSRRLLDLAFRRMST